MPRDLTAEGNRPINALFTVSLRKGLHNKMKTLPKEGSFPSDVAVTPAGYFSTLLWRSMLKRGVSAI